LGESADNGKGKTTTGKPGGRPDPHTSRRDVMPSARLDAITNEQVQRLKLTLIDRAPKTVNNVLTVMSTLLKKAVE
jgi:hypothetical protein